MYADLIYIYTVICIYHQHIQHIVVTTRSITFLFTHSDDKKKLLIIIKYYNIVMILIILQNIMMYTLVHSILYLLIYKGCYFLN